MLTHDHTPSSSITIRSTTSRASATYQYPSTLPKPCFHPLTTAAGVVVTAFEPPDHLWHRGLWFTIKYINGTNFWEENVTPFGKQVTDAEPTVTRIDDNALQIRHTLRWTSDPTGDVILETRTLTISIDADETLAIDWASDLLPLQDLLLGRTPYTTWGGYSGFAFRGSNDLRTATVRFPDDSRETILVATPAPFIILENSLPTPTSITLIGHPDNPASTLSPAPLWYGKSIPDYVFLNAAFLFHQNMSISKNSPLRFRYRCLLRDGYTATFASSAAGTPL